LGNCGRILIEKNSGVIWQWQFPFSKNNSPGHFFERILAMILYFLRHGLADDRAGWLADDTQRPLTKEGKDKMALEAKAFIRLSLSLDSIVSSPLVRAFQTAQIVAQHLDMADKLTQDERLAPGFDLQKLSEVLAAYPGVETVMLVGHEPDFSETISELIGGGRVVCKKGGLARVDVTSQLPLSGELAWLMPPKLLVR
jgi:phosphohistidine phosphatase